MKYKTYERLILRINNYEEFKATIDHLSKGDWAAMSVYIRIIKEDTQDFFPKRKEEIDGYCERYYDEVLSKVMPDELKGILTPNTEFDLF